MDIFNKRTKLEKLQERYRNLMRKSFKIALTDRNKCEDVQEEALKVYNEIKYLNLQMSNN